MTDKEQVDRLRSMILNLTGLTAWYKSEKSPNYWFVTNFTHDQMEGLRANYRAMVEADIHKEALREAKNGIQS